MKSATLVDVIEVMKLSRNDEQTSKWWLLAFVMNKALLAAHRASGILAYKYPSGPLILSLFSSFFFS